MTNKYNITFLLIFTVLKCINSMCHNSLLIFIDYKLYFIVNNVLTVII